MLFNFQDFHCPALQTRSNRWDINNLSMATKVSKIITKAEHKKILHHIEDIFTCMVKPRLDTLPKQCIHADINETNLIFNDNVHHNHPTGLIDFDLAAFNCRVFEISASAAYMMTMYVDDPLEAGVHVTAGYQINNPLTAEEMELLFYLIQARMYQSVCFGTLASQIFPQNSKYLLYTVHRAWKALEKITNTSKSKFDDRLHQLCSTHLQRGAKTIKTIRRW